MKKLLKDWCAGCRKKNSKSCKTCLIYHFKLNNKKTGKPRPHRYLICKKCNSKDYYSQGLCKKCYATKLNKKKWKQWKKYKTNTEKEILQDIIDNPKKLNQLLEEA